ncbi:MAG: GNAT family N-acetyltransferase [Bacteroidota bacterium]
MIETVNTNNLGFNEAFEILQSAFAIRKLVFVTEQDVPADEEYDEFDMPTAARHYLAFADDMPCGTARYRQTENGIKLERFAVLKDYRSKGVGAVILRDILLDIDADPALEGRQIYLNAQVSAIPFYAKYGFIQVGDMFQECDIDHYKMIFQSA